MHENHDPKNVKNAQYIEYYKKYFTFEIFEEKNASFLHIIFFIIKMYRQKLL
jgi:hypothetical protein